MPTHRETLAYRECPYGAMDRRPAVSIAHAIFSQVRQRLRPLRVWPCQRHCPGCADNPARRRWKAGGWPETGHPPIGADPPESACVYNGNLGPGRSAEMLPASKWRRLARRQSERSRRGSLVAKRRQRFPCRLRSGCRARTFRFPVDGDAPEPEHGSKTVLMQRPDAARFRFRGADARKARGRLPRVR